MLGYCWCESLENTTQRNPVWRKMGNRENVCWWDVTTLSAICSVHIWTVLLLQADLYYCSTLQTKRLKWKQMQTTGDLPNTSRTSPCVIKCVKQCDFQSLFKCANAVTFYSLFTRTNNPKSNEHSANIISYLYLLHTSRSLKGKTKLMVIISSGIQTQWRPSGQWIWL